MKKVFRDYISNAAILSSFGLALTILSAAFLAGMLISMGYANYAGAAVVLDALILGLLSAILILRLRREDLLRTQVSLLMGDYMSPEGVARLQHRITELEAELAVMSEVMLPIKKVSLPVSRSRPL